jgi:spermidine synthase
VIRNIVAFNRRIFPHYSYYYTLVPTYPSGVIGFSFCSKKYNPLEDFNPAKAEALKDLKYYSSEIHRAAFVLPRSFKSFLEGVIMALSGHPAAH